jgi:aldehyde:ferredoxin oxidoreductase
MRLARELTGEDEAGDLGSYKGKAYPVHDMGVATGIPDMVGTCKWHGKWLYMDLRPEHYAEALTTGLGRTVTEADLTEASLRLRHLERALECKMGRRRENDTIPEKEFGKSVSRGYQKGKSSVDRAGLESLKNEYYTLRGWDLRTGVPLRATLLQFGLAEIAADLELEGILPDSDEIGLQAMGQVSAHADAKAAAE